MVVLPPLESLSAHQKDELILRQAALIDQLLGHIQSLEARIQALEAQLSEVEPHEIHIRKAA